VFISVHLWLIYVAPIAAKRCPYICGSFFGAKINTGARLALRVPVFAFRGRYDLLILSKPFMSGAGWFHNLKR